MNWPLTPRRFWIGDLHVLSGPLVTAGPAHHHDKEHVRASWCRDDSLRYAEPLGTRGALATEGGHVASSHVCSGWTLRLTRQNPLRTERTGGGVEPLVPTRNTVHVASIEVTARSPIGSIRGVRPRFAAPLASVPRPVARVAAPRNPCAPTSAHGGPSIAPAAPPFDVGRPDAVGVALACLARLALGPSHCEAGDGHRLAPARLSSVLDLEEPTPHRTSGRAEGRARPRSASSHRRIRSGVHRGFTASCRSWASR